MHGDKVSLLAPPEDKHILNHFRNCGLDPEAYRFHAPANQIIAQAADLCRTQSFDKVFFAYIDEQLPELLSSRFPCPVAGIWFHPYALDRRYRWLPPFDKRLRLRRHIQHTLRRPPEGLTIERIYFLDSSAVTAIASLNTSISTTLLPDPWEKIPELTQPQARRHFQLPPDRMIFLHIGSSEQRKGLSDVLAAFEKLSTSSPKNGKHPLLLRVGENDRLNPVDRERLIKLVSTDMALVVDKFVDEPDFIEYFSAADWILLPYRSFRHSSGILSNAIAAGKPVIASDYGMICKNVRDYSCGLLFRHKSVNELTRTIQSAAVATAPKIDSLIRDNLHPNRFITTIRDTLYQ